MILYPNYNQILNNTMYFIQVTFKLCYYTEHYEEEYSNAFIDPQKIEVNDLIGISKEMSEILDQDNMTYDNDSNIDSDSNSDSDGEFSKMYERDWKYKNLPKMIDKFVTISIFEDGKNKILYSSKNNKSDIQLKNVIDTLPLNLQMYHLDKKDCYRDDFNLYVKEPMYIDIDHNRDDQFTFRIYSVSPDNRLFTTLDSQGQLNFYDNSKCVFYDSKQLKYYEHGQIRFYDNEKMRFKYNEGNTNIGRSIFQDKLPIEDGIQNTEFMKFSETDYILHFFIPKSIYSDSKIKQYYKISYNIEDKIII